MNVKLGSAQSKAQTTIDLDFESYNEAKVFTITTAFNLFKSLDYAEANKGVVVIIHSQEQNIILREALKYYLFALDEDEAKPAFRFRSEVEENPEK